MISQFGFETSSSQIEQVDPAIKQLWGHYTTSSNSQQIWVIRAPALLCLHDVATGSCAELVVSASGVVECPQYQMSVVSVTQFAAEITWNNTDVFSSPAVCGPNISVPPVTPVPPTPAPPTPAPPIVTPADVSVFFIGNSYTQGNNLAFEFQKVAQSRMPGTTVTVAQNAVGGRDLGTAAADANLLAHLRGGVKYDFIVLQEYSVVGGFPVNSGRPRRVTGEDSVKTVFSPIAKDMGATLVFYQTWGRRNNEGIPWGYQNFLSMERSLEDGYATYADIARREGCAETMISRAGLLFKKIYESSSSQGLTPSTDSSTLFWKLYDSDGSHTSVIGTYAIATAMFYAMFPQSSYPGWQDTWYKHCMF